MAEVSYTKATYEKAQRIADMVPTLAKCRAKDGSQGVIVPSSDNPTRTGHRTNGLWCSCAGFDRRGSCSHALGVQLYRTRQSEARIAAAQALRAQHGRCREVGCIMTAVVRGGRCKDHSRAICDALGI